MFNRFNPGGEGAKYIKELLPTPQQVKSALKIANRLTKEYKISISCSIPIQPCVIDTKEFENLNFGFCAAGGENAYYTIDSMGNLRMCNHSQLILGNLFKETFKEIVSKKIVNKFISAYPDYCNKCEIKNTCLGGCKASSEVCYGSILKEEPFLAMYK
jgi:radical SAM protein with 4Fe4S-binding SPASM domain